MVLIAHSWPGNGALCGEHWNLFGKSLRQIAAGSTSPRCNAFLLCLHHGISTSSWAIMSAPILIAQNRRMHWMRFILWRFSLSQSKASAFRKCTALHLFIPLSAKIQCTKCRTWHGLSGISIYLALAGAPDPSHMVQTCQFVQDSTAMSDP